MKAQWKTKDEVHEPGYYLMGRTDDLYKAGHSFHVGGRDCDGLNWSTHYSFPSLSEAAEEIEDVVRWADGPTSYSTMGREDWEQYE